MIPDTIQWLQTIRSFELGVWFTPFNWKLDAGHEFGIFLGHFYAQIGPITFAGNYCVMRK